MDGKIKLNLGCGNKILKGFINIDIQLYSGVDLTMDITKLSNYLSPNYADLIYSCHTLEHIDKNETISTLKEWFKVLKPGGVVMIAVPNFEQIVHQYLNTRNVDELVGLTVGGNKNPYDNHKALFDSRRLIFCLESAGFINVKDYDWRDFLPEGYDDFSRAYLPHMDFINGRCMSLNMMATKPIGE